MDASMIHPSQSVQVIIPTIHGSQADPAAHLYIFLEIRDDAQSNKTLYKVQTHASHRVKCSVRWIGEHTVQLVSSDIGLSCWNEEYGKWGETKRSTDG
jgi:hypothetical protein